MDNKKTATLTFTNDTTNAVYIDDCAAARLYIPNDVTFNGVSINAEVSHDRIEWGDHYDRQGDSRPISLGAKRAIFLDLTEFADIPYIRFKAADNALNGKTMVLSYIEVH